MTTIYEWRDADGESWDALTATTLVEAEGEVRREIEALGYDAFGPQAMGIIRDARDGEQAACVTVDLAEPL